MLKTFQIFHEKSKISQKIPNLNKNRIHWFTQTSNPYYCEWNEQQKNHWNVIVMLCLYSLSLPITSIHRRRPLLCLALHKLNFPFAPTCAAFSCCWLFNEWTSERKSLRIYLIWIFYLRLREFIKNFDIWYSINLWCCAGIFIYRENCFEDFLWRKSFYVWNLRFIFEFRN